jgi:hypothetical protein
MPLNLTRGGLSPATITNLSNNKVVRFMFNPYEYTLSKQNSWEKKPIMGENIPNVVFQHGGTESLSLTLYFDSLNDDNDVRQYTYPLWQMMMIDVSAENPKSGKSAPPPVAFEWGKLYFKSIITSMSEKFTLFDPNGVPLRCVVNVTLEQFLDEDEPAPQISNQSASQTQPQTMTATEGDRVDNLAASGTGDPNNWRDVADKNNIDNPMKVQPGQSLNL